jgi:hypothetical protein
MPFDQTQGERDFGIAPKPFQRDAQALPERCPSLSKIVGRFSKMMGITFKNDGHHFTERCPSLHREMPITSPRDAHLVKPGVGAGPRACPACIPPFGLSLSKPVIPQAMPFDQAQGERGYPPHPKPFQPRQSHLMS